MIRYYRAKRRLHGGRDMAIHKHHVLRKAPIFWGNRLNTFKKMHLVTHFVYFRVTKKGYPISSLYNNAVFLKSVPLLMTCKFPRAGTYKHVPWTHSSGTTAAFRNSREAEHMYSSNIRDFQLKLRKVFSTFKHQPGIYSQCVLANPAMRCAFSSQRCNMRTFTPEKVDFRDSFGCPVPSRSVHSPPLGW